MFILLGGCSRGQCSPRLARPQSRMVHGKIPSPACGGRGSHEKNARIFFMGTREGGRRPEGGNTKLAFIPLGSCSQTQYSSRLTTTHKPSICPAWRLPTSPVFIPLGGHSQTQRLSRLPVARKLSVYPAWRLSASSAFIPLGGYPRAQDLSRLAAAHEPSIYPAWRAPNPEPCTERIPSPACGGRWPQAGRGNTKPGFIPLDGFY